MVESLPASRSLGVLHLTVGSDAGGVSRYLHQLNQGLHDRSVRVAVAGQRGAWHELFADVPWPWVDVPMNGGPLGWLKAVRILRRYCTSLPIDLIHAHDRRSSLVGRRLARALHVPLLFTLHMPGIPLRGMRRWLSDFGDHTHVPSTLAKQWLLETTSLTPDHVTTIPHGIDPAKFPMMGDERQNEARRRLGLDPQIPVAAFVGRYDEPKNEQWVVDVAKAAREQLPDARFLMMGRGPREAALRRRIVEENLTERITLLPYGDPQPIYAASDLLLLPSQLEGFGLVALEAMSCGRAVLRTQTGGVEEQIVEHVTGRRCPIRLQPFVSTAVQMLADRSVLQRMGKQAASHVRSHLTFEGQIERTVSLYRQLTQQT